MMCSSMICLQLACLMCQEGTAMQHCCQLLLLYPQMILKQYLQLLMDLVQVLGQPLVL